MITYDRIVFVKIFFLKTLPLLVIVFQHETYKKNSYQLLVSFSIFDGDVLSHGCSPHSFSGNQYCVSITFAQFDVYKFPIISQVYPPSIAINNATTSMGIV